MMKVLIADDEKGVCKLLQHLIDWNSFGLEIFKIVHNGWDALRCIEEETPDIVITDVRMPEYSGIDIIKHVKASQKNIRFIVISGYREFEYARDALKYGADDYLLKPIKKDELTAAINRIVKDVALQTQTEYEQLELQQYVTDTAKKLREDFVVRLMEHHLDHNTLNYQYCMEKLHRNFNKNRFICVIIKADIPESKISYEEKIDFFKMKVSTILEQDLMEQLITFCQGVYRDMIVVVLNLDALRIDEIDDVFYRLISKMREMLKMQNPMIKFTIAKSEAVDSIVKLPLAIHQATIALWERIRKNKDGVIRYQHQLTLQDPKTYVNYAFQKKMLKAIESYDAESAEFMLKDIQAIIADDRNLSGYTIFEIYNEICSSVFLGINSKFSKEQLEEYKKEIQFVMRNISSVDQFHECVSCLIKNIFQKLDEQKESISRKPIREAEEYIARHFHEDIDLERVSFAVGFNSSYFSRVFKEETGKKFIDYLTEMRMQEAQRLLSETDLPIAAIAEQVGYGDDKYFSRAFKKFTGLKPKDYRKLYFM